MNDGRDPLARVFIRRPDYGTAMTRYRSASLCLLLLLTLSLPTMGQTAKSKTPDNSTPPSATTPSERLGAAASWTAYAYKEKSGKVCYVVGEPQKQESTGRKRDHPLAMVTHRSGEKIANVVSFVEGYPLKEGSDVSLDIAGAKFDLFTKGDSAWARTAELDKAIVEAMAKGKHAVVKGVSQNGQPATETYSLAGFAQVLALIDKACDVKR